MGCVGDPLVGNCTPPTSCKPMQTCNPKVFWGGISLTTCTLLFQFAPLILLRQGR